MIRCLLVICMWLLLRLESRSLESLSCCPFCELWVKRDSKRQTGMGIHTTCLEETEIKSLEWILWYLSPQSRRSPCRMGVPQPKNIQKTVRFWRVWEHLPMQSFFWSIVKMIVAKAVAAHKTINSNSHSDIYKDYGMDSITVCSWQTSLQFKPQQLRNYVWLLLTLSFLLCYFCCAQDQPRDTCRYLLGNSSILLGKTQLFIKVYISQITAVVALAGDGCSVALVLLVVVAFSLVLFVFCFCCFCFCLSRFYTDMHQRS